MYASPHGVGGRGAGGGGGGGGWEHRWNYHHGMIQHCMAVSMTVQKDRVQTCGVCARTVRDEYLHTAVDHKASSAW